MPSLFEFTKDMLGFYGAENNVVLSSLILAAEQYLNNAGVVAPAAPEKQALYQVAVATHAKIIHDGDPKGDLGRALTSIILQMKDYGGETP